MASLFTRFDAAMAGLRGLIPLILIYQFGFLYGVVGYFALHTFLKDVICRRTLGLEPLGTMDEFFLYDSDVNKANILTVMHFDKIKEGEEDAFGEFVLNTVAFHSS
jgi:hypothetical protein